MTTDLVRYTVGELIDKLVIVNLKIWHLEENLNLDNINKGKTSKQIIKLNTYRNKLIKSIDAEIDVIGAKGKL